MIDNNDSFTMNVNQILTELNSEVIIVNYNDFTLDMADEFNQIVISPGPSHPNEYPKIFQFLEQYKTKKKILGICLGHQIIGLYFGAKLKQIENVVHGKQSRNKIISINPLYSNIQDNCQIGRYHSWVLDRGSIPNDLEILSVAEDNQVMSIKHRQFKIIGLQFHPESFITQCGSKLLENWLNLI